MFRKLFLIAQKKRPDALNATRKTPALYNVPFLNKIKKNCQKCPFYQKCHFLEVFLVLFRNGTLQRAEVFCVVFSASGRFFQAFKINIQTIFLNFIIREDRCDFGGVKIYRHSFARSKIINKNSFGMRSASITP